MNKEKDFFKTCFNIVAGLEVKNESQAIAKEVVLSEIKNLQQENKQINNTNIQLSTLNTSLRSDRDTYRYKLDKQLENWNKLKEYIETCISIIKENPIDKRTPFENSSLSNLGATLSKMQELEQGSDIK